MKPDPNPWALGRYTTVRTSKEISALLAPLSRQELRHSVHSTDRESRVPKGLPYPDVYTIHKEGRVVSLE